MSGVVGPNIVFRGVNAPVRGGIGTGGTFGTGSLIVGWDDLPLLRPSVRCTQVF